MIILGTILEPKWSHKCHQNRSKKQKLQSFYENEQVLLQALLFKSVYGQMLKKHKIWYVYLWWELGVDTLGILYPYQGYKIPEVWTSEPYYKYMNQIFPFFSILSYIDFKTSARSKTCSFS